MHEINRVLGVFRQVARRAKKLHIPVFVWAAERYRDYMVEVVSIIKLDVAAGALATLEFE